MPTHSGETKDHWFGPDEGSGPPPAIERWNSVAQTNPKYTKQVRGKHGSFTNIDAYYSIHKATGAFNSLAGEKWGWSVEGKPYFEDGHVFVVLQFWHGNKSNYFHTAGGATISILGNDALKAAITDAVTKALSFIGFGADVFFGAFDADKYTAQAAGGTGGGSGPDASSWNSSSASRVPHPSPQAVPQPPAALPAYAVAGFGLRDHVAHAAPEGGGSDPVDQPIGKMFKNSHCAQMTWRQAAAIGDENEYKTPKGFVAWVYKKFEAGESEWDVRKRDIALAALKASGNQTQPNEKGPHGQETQEVSAAQVSAPIDDTPF